MRVNCKSILILPSFSFSSPKLSLNERVNTLEESMIVNCKSQSSRFLLSLSLHLPCRFHCFSPSPLDSFAVKKVSLLVVELFRTFPLHYPERILLWSHSLLLCLSFLQFHCLNYWTHLLSLSLEQGWKASRWMRVNYFSFMTWTF